MSDSESDGYVAPSSIYETRTHPRKISVIRCENDSNGHTRILISVSGYAALMPGAQFEMGEDSAIELARAIAGPFGASVVSRPESAEAKPDTQPKIWRKSLWIGVAHMKKEENGSHAFISHVEWGVSESGEDVLGRCVKSAMEKYVDFRMHRVSCTQVTHDHIAEIIAS